MSDIWVPVDHDTPTHPGRVIENVSSIRRSGDGWVVVVDGKPVTEPASWPATLATYREMTDNA